MTRGGNHVPVPSYSKSRSSAQHRDLNFRRHKRASGECANVARTGTVSPLPGSRSAKNSHGGRQEGRTTRFIRFTYLVSHLRQGVREEVSVHHGFRMAQRLEEPAWPSDGRVQFEPFLG